MVTYGFFNSQNGDRRYNADQMSEYFEGLISDGVYESVGDGMVVEAASGMTVSIGTGRAVIDCKWMDSSADEQITISAADPVNPRYTAIVVRLDRTRRLMEFDAVDGDAAADPDYPTATWTDSVKELVLAYILVSAGATSISQADITDARSLDVCGWVTGLIDHISIENLYLQWVDKFNQYFAEMEVQFQEWFDTLTDHLNINTFVKSFRKNVVIGSEQQSTNNIRLDMTGYNYASDDVIEVYINGLLGVFGTDYFALTDPSDPLHPMVVTTAEAEGTNVSIVVYKSLIGFDYLVDANNVAIVSEDNDSVLLS